MFDDFLFYSPSAARTFFPNRLLGVSMLPVLLVKAMYEVVASADSAFSAHALCIVCITDGTPYSWVNFLN